jgi:uncharacterized membrane protein (DUF2068 family)
MTNQVESGVKPNKPLGIILTALYFAIVNGLFSVLFSIPLLFLSGFLLPAWITIFGVVGLALGILSIATCYGLWVLAEWGRTLAIAICSLSIPLNFLSLKIPGQEITSGSVVIVAMSIAVDVLIIWYLLKDNVKSLYFVSNEYYMGK